VFLDRHHIPDRLGPYRIYRYPVADAWIVQIGARCERVETVAIGDSLPDRIIDRCVYLRDLDARMTASFERGAELDGTP